MVTMYGEMNTKNLTNKEGESERFHQMELNHFMNKFSREKAFMMSNKEKATLKTAIANHPAKKHCPVGFNTNF